MLDGGVAGELLELIPALGAELGPRSVLGSALAAFRLTQIRAATGAELALARRFPALGTERGLGFDLPREDFGGGGGVLNLLRPSGSPRGGDLDIGSGSALDTKHLLLVPIMGADDLGALGAAMEVTGRVLLGLLEGILMFAVPVRRHSGETLADGVRALPQCVAVPQQIGTNRDGPADPAEKAGFVVGAGLDEMRLIAFVADLTEEREFEAFLGGVIGEIVLEGDQTLVGHIQLLTEYLVCGVIGRSE